MKKASDRDAIWKAVLDNRIDVIATDHAPHTLEEKSNTYFNAPSGGPLVQHALLALFEKSKEGVISVEKVIEKTAHAPATLFNVLERGFIREGFFADLVVIDPNTKHTVTKDNLLYKCGWSPLEGTTFSHSIDQTFVNGIKVYESSIMPQNLLAADEVFLTNAIKGIVWVGGYRTKRYVNEMSNRLLTLLNEHFNKAEKV